MTLPVSHPVSIVSFCSQRSNPGAIGRIRKEYGEDCLDRESSKFDKLARAGEYIQVLGAVWSDKSNRLLFLRRHAQELHAPLMFEQAIAEFTANPTKSTLQYTSLPLIKAAAFRIDQDAKSLPDPSEFNGDPATQMFKIYIAALDTQVQKHLNFQLNIIEQNVPDLNKSNVRKILEVANRSIKIKLPPPDYIAPEQESALLPPFYAGSASEVHARLRDDFAREIIAMISSSKI
jgi:hypothetical protein